jgi:MFS family permease
VRRVARIVVGAAGVTAGTVIAAIAGAYAAMWVAASMDRTESGWFWVFFVALPIGLLVGGVLGLYGSLWLAGRWATRQ